MKPEIRINGKYRFVPYYFLSEQSDEPSRTRGKTFRAVTGIISYINDAHRYFTVTYDSGGQVLHEFKF